MPLFPDKPQQTIIIVSTGRTGTTALAEHLNDIYPQILALHEPTPSWRLRRNSSMALCGKMSRQELAQRLANARKPLVDSITRPIYVESNPFLSGFIEAFGDVFNKPKILHIVRDPRTYITSAINFGVFSRIKFFAQAFYPWWFPKPEKCPNPSGPRWSQMSYFKRLAWFWKIVNEDLNRGKDIYGDDYRLIRFEDLFAKDGSGLKQFTDFIGVDYNPKLNESSNSKKVNASEPKRVSKWREWPQQNLQEVYDLCKPLMEQYNYTIP